MTVATRAGPERVAPPQGELVTMGEYAVSSEPGLVLHTLLGSCVAACLYDPVAAVGGMNHFLLARNASGAADIRFGAHAMELLVNAVLSIGARREGLRAKVFGGADLLGGMTEVGSGNARFAAEYLRHEGIACVGGSLGGTHGRRVQFWPTTGRARQIIVDPARAGIPPAGAATARPAPGTVELF